MAHRTGILLLMGAIVLAGGPLALAQQKFPYYSSKLKSSNEGEVQDFPLGVLSASGRLRHRATAIEVVDVGADGPGQLGGLQVGDAIVAINGKAMAPYTNDLDSGLAGPQAALAMALDQGCSLADPKLKLNVLRNNKPVVLEIALPASPRFARTFPAKCPKSAAYRKAAYQWLIDNQAGDGTWPGHIGGDSPVYQVSYVGLALLSAGDREYLPTIAKAVEFSRSNELRKINLNDPTAGPKNWIAAAVAIFLSEYYLATEDESVLPDIQKCCDLLALRVAPNGRMGHHAEITYGGGGLTIVNVHAHLAWALADKCGCRIDRAAWNRSQGEVFLAMTPNGAVGYSSVGRGDDDAAARTGGMAAALVISNQRLDAATAMGSWLILKNNRLRYAHTNCAMGLCFGTAGIKQANSKQLSRHLQNWLPYLELCRSAQGAASYCGSNRNYGGDEYLGLNPLGNSTVALMLSSPESKLYLFGGKTKGWLNRTTTEVPPTTPASQNPPRAKRTPRSKRTPPTASRATNEASSDSRDATAKPWKTNATPSKTSSCPRKPETSNATSATSKCGSISRHGSNSVATSTALKKPFGLKSNGISHYPSTTYVNVHSVPSALQNP